MMKYQVLLDIRNKWLPYEGYKLRKRSPCLVTLGRDQVIQDKRCHLSYGAEIPAGERAGIIDQGATNEGRESET